MKAEWRQDYLIHPEWKLWQNPRQFCFNTDTRLLAQFMDIPADATVLDIGTNNGALLLAADHTDCKELIGVEIQPEAAELARCNADNFQHPCRIIEGDIKEVELPLVDVILCNPPYFPLKALHPGAQLNSKMQARHEVSLTLAQLISHCRRLLKSNGRLFLVHRPERIQEILWLLQENRLGVKRLAIAYDHRDSQAKSLLIEARQDAKCQTAVQEVLWI